MLTYTKTYIYWTFPLFSVLKIKSYTTFRPVETPTVFKRKTPRIHYLNKITLRHLRHEPDIGRLKTSKA